MADAEKVKDVASAAGGRAEDLVGVIDHYVGTLGSAQPEVQKWMVVAMATVAISGIVAAVAWKLIDRIHPKAAEKEGGHAEEGGAIQHLTMALSSVLTQVGAQVGTVAETSERAFSALSDMGNMVTEMGRNQDTLLKNMQGGWKAIESLGDHVIRTSEECRHAIAELRNEVRMKACERCGSTPLIPLPCNGDCANCDANGICTDRGGV